MRVILHIIVTYFCNVFIEESNSAKNVPRHLHDDTFVDVFALCVTCPILQIIFSLNSSLDSSYPISEARDESRHRHPCRRCRRRRPCHRRSYRRGKLSETDSLSSRLRGSMLLPNSTKVGDRICQ